VVVGGGRCVMRKGEEEKGRGMRENGVEAASFSRVRRGLNSLAGEVSQAWG